MPLAAASVARSGSASAASISRHTSATSAAWRSASGGWSGRQRRQGRKPALSAAAVLAWKVTLLRSAGRAPHEGRQYTPVVRTA